MARVTAQAELGSITDSADFQRFASQFIQELAPVVNGALEFDLNIKSQTLLTYFAATNVDQAISHSLLKTGVNFIVGNKTASCDIFHGQKIDTDSIIYLRSTVAGVTVTLTLY